MTIKEKQNTVQALIKKINDYIQDHILTIPECLLMFPDYTLITIHNGFCSKSDYKNENIKTVRNGLPQHLMRAEVKTLTYDTNFGRNAETDKDQPVAILELADFRTL